MWNSRADQEAAKAHQKRSPELARVWENLIRHHEAQERDLCGLLHWDVGECYVRQGARSRMSHEGVNEFSFSSLAVDIMHDAIVWLDGIPHDWAVQVHGTSLQQRFGDKFIRRCIEIFKDHHCGEGSVLRHPVAPWYGKYLPT